MKANIQSLIEKFQSEKKHELLIREDLLKTLDEAKAQREKDRQDLIELLVPDTSSETLKEIQEKFEHFYIPCVEKWSWWPLGFKSVLNSNVSLEDLRKRLYDYISKMKLWPLDVDGTNKINTLINQSLALSQKAIESLDMKLEALRKLYDVDETKLNPEMRKQMRTAISSFYKRDKKQLILSRDDLTVVRDYSQVSNNDTSLELWFWYMILSDDSALSAELSSEALVTGAEFDGGGAEQDISFNEDPLLETNLRNEDLDIPVTETVILTSEIVSDEVSPETPKSDDTFSGAAFSLDTEDDSAKTSSRSADCVVEPSNCDCSRDCTSNCDCTGGNDD